MNEYKPGLSGTFAGPIYAPYGFYADYCASTIGTTLSEPPAMAIGVPVSAFVQSS